MRLRTIVLISVTLAALAATVAVYTQTQRSASAGYTINISVSSEFNPITARRFNYSIIIQASYEFSPVAARRQVYTVYSVVCLSINVTRASGVTDVVIRDSCTVTGVALTIAFSYSGFLCSDMLSDYVYIVDTSTGIPVASVYMALAEVQRVVLARANYMVVFPRTAPCAVGNCFGNLSSIVIGGTTFTSNAVNITLSRDTTIAAMYAIHVVPPCASALMVSPFTSVSIGACPDGSGTCFWFGTALAVRYTCTLLGETIITVYEYQHQEEIRLSLGGRTVASLPPGTHQNYRARVYRVGFMCPLCAAAVSRSCRVVSLAPQQQQQQTIALPQLTISPPSVGVSAPDIASPQGLVMSGALVCLFAFLVKKVKWTVALFITSVVMMAMSVLLLGSVEMLAVGVAIAIASIVMDRYM